MRPCLAARGGAGRRGADNNNTNANTKTNLGSNPPFGVPPVMLMD